MKNRENREKIEKLGVAMTLLGLVMMMMAFSFSSREIMVVIGSLGFISSVVGVFMGISSRKN